MTTDTCAACGKSNGGKAWHYCSDCGAHNPDDSPFTPYPDGPWRPHQHEPAAGGFCPARAAVLRLNAGESGDQQHQSTGADTGISAHVAVHICDNCLALFVPVRGK